MTTPVRRPSPRRWWLALALLIGCAMPDPDRPPRLYRVIVPVPDIEAAARFYGVLTGLPGERVSPGRHYLDLGGVLLALYDPAADGDTADPGPRFHENQYLYLAVGDLEAARARAEAAGARLLTPIESMPWGERLTYLHDPFGTPLCLVDEATLFTGGGPPDEEPGSP